jgi:dTDP-glucose pyrophosphorylase
MDRFGANGEALLDYSVYDALRSGFTDILFIIRHDLEKDFREHILRRMEGVPYRLAFQELDKFVPPAVYEAFQQAGRTKPWGTAQAVLCGMDQIDAPFCVINSDDFYGREAFAVMAPFLAQENLREGAFVPYPLEKTLSPRGTVTRGVCRVQDGRLVEIEELLRIEKQGGAIFNTDPEGRRQPLEAECPVSMNFWGFPESILPRYQDYFEAFISRAAENPQAALKEECYIPKAVDHFIQEGILRFRALEAQSEWFGVTYQEDKETAIAKLRALTAAGVYPARLSYGK